MQKNCKLALQKLQLANRAAATRYINFFHSNIAAFIIRQKSNRATHQIHPVHFMSSIQHLFCNQNQGSTIMDFKKNQDGVISSNSTDLVFE